MTSFDPKDPKYQLSQEFPPDKESLWAYPKEEDGKLILMIEYFHIMY
jgi:hypothetical protein